MQNASTPPFGLVVSTCRASDLRVWRRTSSMLPRMVSARRYLVVVPDDEVGIFQEISPPQFEVRPETAYVGDLGGYIADHLRGFGQEHRVGWYLQQFAKLHAVALESVEELPSLIWDADTVPVRPLHLQQHDPHRLVYFTGTEDHQPYFSLIERILGLQRLGDFSFIAQCFPIWAEWLAEFQGEVEVRQGKPWDRAIVDQIDATEPSGFSEYETLGTWILKRHPTGVSFTDVPWLRFGASRYGSVSWLSDKDLLGIGSKFAHVTFEAHERPTWKLRLRSSARIAFKVW